MVGKWPRHSLMESIVPWTQSSSRTSTKLLIASFINPYLLDYSYVRRSFHIHAIFRSGEAPFSLPCWRLRPIDSFQTRLCALDYNECEAQIWTKCYTRSKWYHCISIEQFLPFFNLCVKTKNQATYDCSKYRTKKLLCKVFPSPWFQIVLARCEINWNPHFSILMTSLWYRHR